MKLIVLKDGGSTRAVQLSPARLALGGSLAAALMLAAAVTGYRLAADQPGFEAAVAVESEQQVDQWQTELASQQTVIKALSADADATSEAVGRQLARMQARLLRMEAIGSRVVQIADLDAEEFSFVEQAPQGGPVSREIVVPLANLRTDLDALSVRLTSREQELQMLESFLTDKEYRRGVAIAGRPITWGWLSSNFGTRVDPISGKKAWHAGVDFAGKDGSDVIAVASGVVTFAGKRSGYGHLVEIDHGDGYRTRYAHHKTLKVASGDIVKKGQVVGLMGSSGRSTGPHVHFEVLKNGKHVDPAKYVASRK
ncbi:MAG: M23 family metallopeptidase [Pseudomonadales bacterium]